MTKMIPPIPTSAVMLSTPKQKIGFSIESIVGHDATTTTTTITATTNIMNTVGENNTGNSNNNNNNITSTNNNNNNSSKNHTGAKSNDNGPTSPPQSPPIFPTVIGSTHLPTTPHLQLPSVQQQHMHLLQPPHTHQLQQQPHHQLSAAQQHALHQHIILQQAAAAAAASTPKPNFPNTDIVSPSMRHHDIQDIIQRLHNSAAAAHHHNTYSSPQLQSPQTRLCTEQEEAGLHLKRERSPMPMTMENAQNPAQRHQGLHTPPKSVSPQSSHPSPPPGLMTTSPATTPQQQHPIQQSQYQTTPPPAGPMLMSAAGMAPAGLVRPFPVVMGGGPVLPPPPQSSAAQPAMPDIKALPPYINTPPELAPQHNPHLIAAAQFQMAAALQGACGIPPHAPFMTNPGMPRDSYPLYPWLLSRHGRIFPHRFPGNFLLQPFRKPKRIRTAFSPSQLLKLEHAFESNQYVVGAERKALAQSLNLSETQVKVWFQNRRTKHKRMQQEDEKGCTGSSTERNSFNTSCDEDDDDELIDMEMDDECLSDDDHELDTSH